MMSTSRLVSTREISRHNTPGDCWVVIDDRIWDVTSFSPHHPGGTEVIVRYAGQDATAAYNEVHSPSVIIKSLSTACLIGRLDPSSIDDDWNDNKPQPSQPQTNKPPLHAILSSHDFEDAARSTLSKKAWAYYSSAATDTISHRANQSFFNRIWFRPRLLRNVSNVSTKCTVLGASCELPIIVAPVALARLANSIGEKGIAAAVAKKGIRYCIPITASFPAEEIIASAPTYEYFFQLYVNKNRSASEDILRRIWGLGIRTLFVTIDTPVPGKREADERVDAEGVISMPMTGTKSSQDAKGGGITRTTGSFLDDTLGWNDLVWLRTHWRGKLVLKGVQSVEDALMATEARVDGIVLSNHGGRNLDTSPPALLNLLELQHHAPHVLQQIEVLVDGGIRRGTDILKAICLGARAVLIGRPAMYSLTYGQEGVEHWINNLASELQVAMKLVGITDLSQARRGLVNTQDIDHLVVQRLDEIWVERPCAKI